MGVTMDAVPGELAGIIGPNGAGRTTLLSRTADEPLALALNNDGLFNRPTNALDLPKLKADPDFTANALLDWTQRFRSGSSGRAIPQSTLQAA